VETKKMMVLVEKKWMQREKENPISNEQNKEKTSQKWSWYSRLKRH
jgi:hypothetical protein